MVRTCQSTFDFEYSFSIHCVKGHRDSMELQRFKEAASKIKERSADIEVTCFSESHSMINEDSGFWWLWIFSIVVSPYVLKKSKSK